MVADAGGVYREDYSQPPLLLPLSLLGCRVRVEELTRGNAHSGATCKILGSEPLHGGAELQSLVVEPEMFEASVMVSGGEVGLEEMKLPQLKEELAARDAKRTGMKATLQRRLHALLMQAAIAQRAEEMDVGTEAEAGSEAGSEEEGSSDGERSSSSESVQQRGRKRQAPPDSSDEEGAHR